MWVGLDGVFFFEVHSGWSQVVVLRHHGETAELRGEMPFPEFSQPGQRP